MAPYFNAVQKYLAGKPELFALSHVNLQIDNAWFWRSKVIKRERAQRKKQCGPTAPTLTPSSPYTLHRAARMAIVTTLR